MIHKSTLEVVCAIIQDGQGRILAAKRPKGKSLAHKWEFPGGKVQKSETYETALLREIEEELAVSLLLLKRLNPIKHKYDFGFIVLIPFLAKIESGIPTAIEHEELLWIDLKNILSIDWADADRTLLNKHWAELT